MGLFKTVAKGAMRPQSVFSGRLDLFVTCEVLFQRNPKSDLHRLNEVHLSQPRLQLRSSYARVLAATYFAKLVELVAERETPLSGVHELLVLSLDYLNTHDPTPRLVHRFEGKLCEELGLGAITAGAAGVLHETFHRPLPPQRSQLLEALAASQRGEGVVTHDFT